MIDVMRQLMLWHPPRDMEEIVSVVRVRGSEVIITTTLFVYWAREDNRSDNGYVVHQIQAY